MRRFWQIPIGEPASVARISQRITLRIGKHWQKSLFGAQRLRSLVKRPDVASRSGPASPGLSFPQTDTAAACRHFLFISDQSEIPLPAIKFLVISALWHHAGSNNPAKDESPSRANFHSFPAVTSTEPDVNDPCRRRGCGQYPRGCSLYHCPNRGRSVPDRAGERHSVRRQSFWASWRAELREGLAHLVHVIMRRICGEASAAFRWSSV